MCPVCFDVYVLLTMWWDMMCESVYCLSMRCEVRKVKGTDSNDVSEHTIQQRPFLQAVVLPQFNGRRPAREEPEGQRQGKDAQEAVGGLAELLLRVLPKERGTRQKPR